MLTLRSPFAYFRASKCAYYPTKKVFSLKKLAKTCCFFSYEQRERIELEYQTCLSKALDDCPDNMEQCLQMLADYCNKANSYDHKGFTIYDGEFNTVREFTDPQSPPPSGR